MKVDLKKGDEILVGKWQNKRIKVSKIGTNELGQPTVNGKPMLRFRIVKKMPKKTAKIMEHLSSWDDFNINESKNQPIYRTTVFEWIKGFLTKGVATPPKDKKFISFSKDQNSGAGESDQFGDILVDFDAKELYRQGAQDVEYTIAFFKSNPDICMYVTDYANQEDYDDWVKDRKNELTWKEFVEGFKSEEEVILKKLKMKPGLIKKVTIWDADGRDDIPEIKKFMSKYKIKVEVPWD